MSDFPKRPNFLEYEPRLYQMWEKAGYFTPKIDSSKKPFTILLPPPNANDPLHAGHAMYVIEDILCRYHRMLGQPALFLPGTDHAGIETQFVFEKKLARKGKSRFDFDRETLYQMISDYVEENRDLAKEQLKKLGFSLDWTREKYTLEPKVLEVVFDTFRKLHQDGLIYRAERLVNFCTRCGTGFSNLEVDYIERKDPLYYLAYGPFTLATTRPETKFGDTAVAVHPADKRHQGWVGQEFTYESLIGPRKMRVVADEAVDPEFGTGVVKVTPAHDPNDFDIAKRHNLGFLKVIDRNGRLNENTGYFAGLTVKEAREKVVEKLQKRGDLIRIDQNYVHRVGVCYRCKEAIEPLLLPQWYVKVESLVAATIKALKNEEVKLFPPRFKKELLRWLATAPDWNISRQIVWGPRIPAWYCLACNPEIEITFLAKGDEVVTGKAGKLIEKYSLGEIKQGLQELIAPVEAAYQLTSEKCQRCGNSLLLQETDTFDTWFSSGQWPLTTLGYPAGEDYKYFYPTSVLDTMWDILPFWVMRMLMLGIYRTGQVPFDWVHLHSRVVDAKGKKMSKSLGNVIEPIDVAKKYSTDALRFALVFGIAPASNIPLGDEKLIGARNFVTKIWNVARFILGQTEKPPTPNPKPQTNSKFKEQDRKILKDLKKLTESVTEKIESFQFGLASTELYDFVWNKFASEYLESTKERQDENATSILLHVLRESLKLLHPFMPFVSEEIYQKLPNKDAQSIMIAPWPKIN